MCVVMVIENYIGITSSCRPGFGPEMPALSDYFPGHATLVHMLKLLLPCMTRGLANCKCGQWAASNCRNGIQLTLSELRALCLM